MLESGVKDQHNTVYTSALLREIVCFKLSSIIHGKHCHYPVSKKKAGAKNNGKESNFYENRIFAKNVASSRTIQSSANKWTHRTLLVPKGFGIFCINFCMHY